MKRSDIRHVFEILAKDVTFFGSLVFNFFLIALFFSFGYYQLSLVLFVGLFLAYIVVFAIRASYYRERPQKQKYSSYLQKIDSSSFPSMHACRSTIIFLLVGAFFHNILIWFLLGTILLLVGVSRIYLKKHYLTDVLGGLLIGVLISVILVQI